MRNWVLPEFIEDVLPAEAERTEALRRTLLDHFRAHGYRLVQPPLVEHLDSLFTGTGPDLELQTFKGADPLSGPVIRGRAGHSPHGAPVDTRPPNAPRVSRPSYTRSLPRLV